VSILRAVSPDTPLIYDGLPSPGVGSDNGYASDRRKFKSSA
jgi:hypothetical protein